MKAQFNLQRAGRKSLFLAFCDKLSEGISVAEPLVEITLIYKEIGVSLITHHLHAELPRQHGGRIPSTRPVGTPPARFGIR
jgi:hypothetical protein